MDEIVLRHVVPPPIKLRGVEMRLVQEVNGNPTAKPDPALIEALARTQKWFEDLMSGRIASLREIEKAEGVTPHFMGSLFPLAFLAPHIVEAILTEYSRRTSHLNGSLARSICLMTVQGRDLYWDSGDLHLSDY